MRVAKIILEEDGKVMWAIEIRPREGHYVSINDIAGDVQTVLNFLNHDDKKTE